MSTPPKYARCVFTALPVLSLAFMICRGDTGETIALSLLQEELPLHKALLQYITPLLAT